MATNQDKIIFSVGKIQMLDYQYTHNQDTFQKAFDIFSDIHKHLLLIAKYAKIDIPVITVKYLDKDISIILDDICIALTNMIYKDNHSEFAVAIELYYNMLYSWGLDKYENNSQ